MADVRKQRQGSVTTDVFEDHLALMGTQRLCTVAKGMQLNHACW